MSNAPGWCDMAKNPKAETRQRTPELAPDAWERFERAVDAVAKSKPRPKSKVGGKSTDKKGESPKKSASQRTAG